MASVADKAAPKLSGFYYGWWVLLAAAVGEMLAQGSTSYGAGLFVKPLGDELGLSRATANSSLAVLYLGGALWSPIAGWALDRYSAKWVIAIGALAMGLGFIAIGLASSLTLMTIILFIPVAFGFVAIGPLTASTLVSRWFYKRRGRALGFAAVATSGGGAIVVPFLNAGIHSFGWRITIMLEGAFIAVAMCAISLAIIRGRPWGSWLYHGENDGRASADLEREIGTREWGYARILGNGNFWALMIAMAIISSVIQALVVTIVPYATDLGFKSESATDALLGAVAVTGAIVKIISGTLADYTSRRLILCASAVSLGLALAVFLLRVDYTSLFVACCLIGVALGCELPSSSALVADCFGARSVGTVLGVIYIFIALSIIVSVRFAGTVFDMTGHYQVAFLVFVTLAFVAAVAALLVRPRQA